MRKVLACFLIAFSFILAFSANFSLTNLSFCEEELNEFVENSANRTAGSEGEKESANFIQTKLEEINIQPLYESYQQTFDYNDSTSQNVLGLIDNAAEKYVVIGAHYDNVHRLGESEGVNDNASGVITSLNLASYFSNSALNFNIIFALNRVLNPGAKKLVEFAIKNCKILPKDFEKGVNFLCTCSTALKLTTADKIVENLRKIVEVEF